MVIGCKLCEEPLVNKAVYENCKLRMKLREEAIQKAQKYLLDPSGNSIGPESAFCKPENLVLAAKCGHCFHKNCLKRFIAASHNGVGECPYCSKPIHLAHTWPILVHLGPKDQSTFDSAEKISEENEIIRDQIFEIKKSIEEKEEEMKSIYHKISETRFDLSERTKKQTDEITSEVDQCRELEEERKRLEQRIVNLNRENTKILKKIAELAENEGGDGQKEFARNECLSRVKWPLTSKKSTSSSSEPGVLFKPKMFGEECQISRNLLVEKEDLISHLTRPSCLTNKVTNKVTKRMKEKEQLMQKRERKNYEELASKIGQLDIPKTLAKKKILATVPENDGEESDLTFVHYRASPRTPPPPPNSNK